MSIEATQITKAVVDLPTYRNAKRLSVFLSMPIGEVSTHDIAAHALRQGKRVFVPYIHRYQPSPTDPPVATMEMLALHSLEDLDSLKRDNWGIPTLDRTSIAGRENALGSVGIREQGSDNDLVDSDFQGLDLILMPGLAFDSSNRRLGHGKGFYDRYLQRYKKLASRRQGSPQMPLLGKYPLAVTCSKTENSLVGLALKQQILPAGEVIPCGSDDWPVNHVIDGTLD